MGLIDAGGCGRHTKDLDHAASLGACVTAVSPADVVRRDAALLVGGARQGDQCVFAGDTVLYLYGVSRGINVRDGGLHTVIDHNAAPDAQFQPGFLCQGRIRCDADGENDHIRVERFPVFQQDIHPMVFFRKAVHGMAKDQPDAMSAHFAVDKGSHIRIKGIHQLLWPLYNGHIHTQFPQVFCQFQSDKSTAGQHGRQGMVLADIFFHAEGVFHGTQGENFVDAHTGKSGPGGRGAGRENQLVIAFLKHGPVFQICDGNGFSVRMNGCDLVAHLHAYSEACLEALRSLECQLFRVGDHIPDIIGQAAVGIGYIAGTLKYHDPGLLIQSSDAGCGCCAACHTAYNHYFHITFPPFRSKRQCRRYCLRWYIPCAAGH